MSRSVPFRRTVTDAVSWRQDQAQNATIYILRETGPTGFLLKEEGEVKNVKVFLGDPHTCTCPVYKKEKDLCKHICWVLLKKFRVPREDSESFQLGLVEREINALLRGRTHQEAQRNRNVTKMIKENGRPTNVASDGKDVLPQREITKEDVCPICQDEFLAAREPVTYCRFGCAKSVHIKCMKVWAEHQQSTGETNIKCPLCREDFGEIEFLQKEYRNSSLQKTQAERGIIHRGVVCFQCNQSPIAGRCYRCMECKDKFLCQDCFSSNSHSRHEFQFRQKPNQRWRPAQRSSEGTLPQAVLEDMQNRELQDEDYELLLQLDSDGGNKASTIPEDVVKSFPTEKIKEGGALTSPGVQCRVCLRGFTVGQVARRLPCRHKFHKECIDQWLVHEHPTCPVDGTVVWNPLTANRTACERRNNKNKKPTQDQGQQNHNQQFDLSGLGVTGVSAKTHHTMPGRCRTRVIQLMNRGSGERADEGLSAQFQLMGLGFGSQQGSSTSENVSSHDGHLQAPGNMRSPQSQRTHNNSDLESGRRVNSILSSHSFPDGHVSIYSSTTLASHSNMRAEDAEIGAAAYANEDQNKLLSNSNLPSPEVPLNIHDESHHTSNLTSFNGLSNHREPRQKPPLGGTRCRKSKVHEHRNIPSSTSVLTNDKDNSFGLTASRLTTSNNAPSTSKRTSGSPGRGRADTRRILSKRRRVRSTSTGRNTSSDRFHSNQPEKVEMIQNLFLGSPQGKLMFERSQGQISRHGQIAKKQHRANSLPRRSEETTMGLEITLSGYRVGGLQ